MVRRSTKLQVSGQKIYEITGQLSGDLRDYRSVVRISTKFQISGRGVHKVTLRYIYEVKSQWSWNTRNYGETRIVIAMSNDEDNDNALLVNL